MGHQENLQTICKYLRQIKGYKGQLSKSNNILAKSAYISLLLIED